MRVKRLVAAVSAAVLMSALFVTIVPAATAGAAPAQSAKPKPKPKAPKARSSAPARAATVAPTVSGAVIDDPGCDDASLPPNDDDSRQVDLPFVVDLFGSAYTTAYVNNNGNLTFQNALSAYTPFEIDASIPPMIAPFFADVDTRAEGSGVVTYGTTEYGGRPALCVNWRDVGYYYEHADLTNSFQLLLVSRGDIGAGDFDIIMNYDRLQWETGDYSGGSGGFGGTAAGAGFSAGDGDPAHFFQFPGSMQSFGLIDAAADGGLVAGSRGSLQLGRYIFPIRNGAAPGSAELEGTVTQTGGATVAGAPVQACRAGGSCVLTYTNGAGSYSLVALAPGTYTVYAFPPAGSNLIPATAADVDVADGATTIVNLEMRGPTPPPPGSGVTDRGTTPDGVPIVYWNDPLTITATGCPGGTASYEIVLEGGVAVRSGPMEELPPGSGMYEGSSSPLYPDHGAGSVLITITCPDLTTEDVGFNIYIDPSGVIVDEFDAPVAGATVTLLRSDSEVGPFTVVPDGSDIMSPSNRTNPMVSGADGSFGWDVIAGYYRVDVTKDGCHAPGDAGNPVSSSEVLTIPPPVTDLRLVLDCSPPAPPTVSVGDATVMQGQDGKRVLSFPVTLSEAQPATVTVRATTVADTAVAGVDFRARAATVRFPKGKTEAFFDVTVEAAPAAPATFVPVPDKTMTVELSDLVAPAPVELGDDEGLGTIVAGDGAGAVLSVSANNVYEGTTGKKSNYVKLTVCYSRRLEVAQVVTVTTGDGIATIADNDYVAKSVTLKFNPRQSCKKVLVTVVADQRTEPNESFTVTANDGVQTSVATIGIFNDD